jgi:tetratricopeptide (TPR) repeat protein
VTILATGALAASLAVAPQGGHQALIQRYAAGDRTALDALWRLHEDAVRAEVVWVRKLAARRRTEREEAIFQAYPFTAAVRAHTELYLRAHLAEDPAEIERQEGYARGFLEASRERLPALSPLWHLYLAVHHLEALELELAERFAADGRRAHALDGRLWLASGTIAQTTALFAPERPWRLSATAPGALRRRGPEADRRALRHEARRQLGRALQLDPNRHEAALRLAQIGEALGDLPAAVQALERVPEDLDRPLAYVALLLRGRLHARLDRPAEAVASYRRATELLPGAESAWMALSHALDGVGEAREAQAALERVLAADDRRSASDPFRMFPIFCAGGAHALWNEMGGDAP